MVVVGGRAPANRWGSGSLQELDHLPIVAPVTKHGAHPAHRRRRRSTASTRPSPPPGPRTAARPSSTCRWTSSSTPRAVRRRPVRPATRASPTPTRSRPIARLLGEAGRPVLILGTDVWADGAEEAALRLVEALGLPTITNGMGRGVVPGGHPLLVTKARGAGARHQRPGRRGRDAAGLPARATASSAARTGATPAQVVHLADSPGQVSGHAELAGSASGDLTTVLDGLLAGRRPARPRPDWAAWVADLQQTGRARPPSATPRCWAPRPTRSTRRASTASWSPGWPTTRS